MHVDKCAKCGSTKKLVKHHIIPRTFGGTEDPNNLQLLCEACHFEVHFGFKPPRPDISDLDFTDMQILRVFYNPCRPWLQPVLYRRLKRASWIKMGVEGFRKRLQRLVKKGLLKCMGSNPSVYTPKYRAKEAVLGAIDDWFMEMNLPK